MTLKLPNPAGIFNDAGWHWVSSLFGQTWRTFGEYEQNSMYCSEQAVGLGPHAVLNYIAMTARFPILLHDYASVEGGGVNLPVLQGRRKHRSTAQHSLRKMEEGRSIAGRIQGHALHCGLSIFSLCSNFVYRLLLVVVVIVVVAMAVVVVIQVVVVVAAAADLTCCDCSCHSSPKCDEEIYVTATSELATATGHSSLKKKRAKQVRVSWRPWRC